VRVEQGQVGLQEPRVGRAAQLQPAHLLAADAERGADVGLGEAGRLAPGGERAGFRQRVIKSI
jgi:hypothetical protein